MQLKKWSEMTDIEKGELLLAHHNGRTIEVLAEISGNWMEVTAPLWNASSIYRARPAPKLETATITAEMIGRHPMTQSARPNISISFDMIDGVPDCKSVRMGLLAPNWNT